MQSFGRLRMPVMLGEFTLGGRSWLPWAVVLLLVGLALVVSAYRRAHSRSWVRVAATVLKGIGIVALAVCLVDPLYTGTRPRPGSNLFLVVVDNSRSLQIGDGDGGLSRGRQLQERLRDDTSWLTRLAQDFDVRRYLFDTQARPAKSFSELTHDGTGSAIHATLAALADRFRDQPVAGILLLTDGNATDSVELLPASLKLPPIYPVAVGSDRGLIDLSISNVAVSQTNFEASPVTISVTLDGHGVADQSVGLLVLDGDGKEVERRTIKKLTDGEPTVQRFLLKPDKAGISVYTVQAFLPGEESLTADASGSREATLANNRRLVTVDRGGGPFRVLYVTGRPNWEYKFLRRAVAEDDEVQLVGLIRIAKKEPKFTFLGRSGERTNPLFRGFGNKDELAEQYDEPVLLRLGTKDAEELRGGFPKDAETLFGYHAVILDDIEAGFFTQDQLSLLQQFVTRRGGGFLMLGGAESFGEGGYARTIVGEMLPVYPDRIEAAVPEGGYRLRLTREGWLQPWVRLRSQESEEETRLASMPAFVSVNRVKAIKPGASVLAQVTTADGSEVPALVVQPFGRGRTAAMLIGDLWRWNLRRGDHTQSDLEKSWRQTVRWLVGDVPARVEAESQPAAIGALPARRIIVRVRDPQFAPLDNAAVTLRVQTPDDRQIELTTDASDQTAGQYETLFAPRVAGSYRAAVRVTAADGSDVGQREIGWTAEPDTDEFRTLAVNRNHLKQLATRSGGEVVSLDGLEEFVSSLPNRKIPIVETWTYPLWHQRSVFFFAVACLIGEWGLRRWRGMP